MSENKTPQPGDSQDPLASLHRMSTTAGIASQEYVAINLAAVAAFVLGLASALVLMSNVLLVVPLAAVAFGVVAIRQIGNSSGTQTGRPIALLGMLVALGLATFIGVREYRAYAAKQAELAVIDQLVGQLQQKVLAKDAAGTLSLFDPEFLNRKHLTMSKFETTVASIAGNPLYGNLKSLTTNGVIVLGQSNAETGPVEAGTMLLLQFTGAEHPMRLDTTFRKFDGQWKILDIPLIFPSPNPAGGGGAGGPPSQGPTPQ